MRLPVSGLLRDEPAILHHAADVVLFIGFDFDSLPPVEDADAKYRCKFTAQIVLPRWFVAI